MTRLCWIPCFIWIGSAYGNILDIVPAHFPALLEEEQSHYGTVDVIIPMPDQGGSLINDVYLITTSLGADLVLKVENTNWARRKTLNEVSSIRYVAENTEIPVPTVVKYHNQIGSSPLGVEYILMTRIKGKAFNLIIDEIYHNKNNYLKILNDLADVIASLHSIQFDYMGNVENRGNELTVISPIEFPISVIDKPCPKFSDYAFAWLSYYVSEMKRLKRDNHPNQESFSRLIPRLENILKTNYFTTLDTPEDLFVYCHQDFVMKNILIDNGSVSGVLDWEWSGPALPEFEIQTGFDFLPTQEDRKLFEELMLKRGFPNFFRSPPLERQLFYELVGHLYSLISCYEWIEGKLEHSAKFLAQKLEQRAAKKTKNFEIDKFSNEKTKIIEELLIKLGCAKEPRSTLFGAPTQLEACLKPVALFGLSGVGKTTLAHDLVALAPDQFSILPITTSRPPREDDDINYMEFLSQKDFISALEDNFFALSWQQDENYYGYRRHYFENGKTHPIMTCSLSAIQLLKEQGAITVLITGDSAKGLEARGSNEVMRKRTELNAKNTDLYLNQPWFRENVDIEHNQIWGDPLHSVQNLYDSIHSILE